MRFAVSEMWTEVQPQNPILSYAEALSISVGLPEKKVRIIWRTAVNSPNPAPKPDTLWNQAPDQLKWILSTCWVWVLQRACNQKLKHRSGNRKGKEMDARVTGKNPHSVPFQVLFIHRWRWKIQKEQGERNLNTALLRPVSTLGTAVLGTARYKLRLWHRRSVVCRLHNSFSLSRLPPGWDGTAMGNGVMGHYLDLCQVSWVVLEKKNPLWEYTETLKKKTHPANPKEPKQRDRANGASFGKSPEAKPGTSFPIPIAALICLLYKADSCEVSLSQARSLIFSF